MSNSDEILTGAISSMSGKKISNSVSVLKFDYDEDKEVLSIKQCTDTVFNKIAELNLDEADVRDFASAVRECSRKDSNSKFISCGSYDFNIEYKKPELKIGIMECSGNKSKSLGTFKFTKYMGCNYIPEGITKFLSKL
jgi:hypothetical protein